MSASNANRLVNIKEDDTQALDYHPIQTPLARHRTNSMENGHIGVELSSVSTPRRQSNSAGGDMSPEKRGFSVGMFRNRKRTEERLLHDNGADNSDDEDEDTKKKKRPTISSIISPKIPLWKFIFTASIFVALIVSVVTVAISFNNRVQPGGLWPQPQIDTVFEDTSLATSKDPTILGVKFFVSGMTADSSGATMQTAMSIADIPDSFLAKLPNSTVPNGNLRVPVCLSIHNRAVGNSRCASNSSWVQVFTNPVQFENGTVMMYPFDKWETFLLVSTWNSDSFVTSNLSLSMQLQVGGTIVGWKFTAEQLQQDEISQYLNAKGFSSKEAFSRGPTFTESDQYRGLILVKLSASRNGVFLFYPILQMIALWFITLSAVTLTLCIVVFQIKALEPIVIGFFLALTFAIPAFRNTAPMSPPIGCLMDVVGFYWSMFLVSCCFVAIVLKYTLSKPTPPAPKPVVQQAKPEVNTNPNAKSDAKSKKKKNQDDDVGQNVTAADATGAGDAGASADAGAPSMDVGGIA